MGSVTVIDDGITNTPVHLMDCVSIDSVLTRSSERCRGEQSCVDLEKREEEQKGLR